MKSLVTRLLAFLCVFSFGISIFVTPVHAASESWAVPSVQEFSDFIMETLSGVIHKEGSETNSVIVSMFVVACGILGCSDLVDSLGRPHPFHYNRSAVAYVGNAIGYLYESPPASTYAFAVDMGKTMGFLPRTYAQGFGFTGLGPLLGIWKIFRNIAYGIIAIIMIVIGFMVMLRKKIDPKTVVTVQNSIPRIVIALILVTFSYAIVGFMIDLMYVSMLLIANVLIGSSAPGSVPTSTLWGLIPIGPKDLVEGNFLTVISAFFAGGWSSFVGILRLFSWETHAKVSAITGIVAFVATGFNLKNLVLGAIAPQALPLLIVALAVLIGIVRLFFLLLDAYIHIIIALLTSPFHLMMEAIPGTNSFSSWFRNLFGKLLVFPTVIAILLITFILTSDQTQATGTVWGPPLIWGTTTVPGLGGLIGLGMLLSLPSIVGGIQKSLKGEPLVPAGIGTIVGPLGSGISQLMNLYYQTTMIRAYSKRDHAPSPYQQGVTAAGQSPSSILTGGGGQKS